MLKEHITFGKIEVKNPELPKDLIDKKAGILDIKAELNENQICDIEIPKFIKKNCGINTKLEQWLWLLTGKGEKVEMAEKENKEIKKAIEILEEMSMDEKEWELYQSRKMAEIDYNGGIASAREEGREEGEKVGIEKGERKGKKEAKIQIAKKLIESGMELEKVAQVTGLSENEIKEITTKEN